MPAVSNGNDKRVQMVLLPLDSFLTICFSSVGNMRKDAQIAIRFFSIRGEV